MSRRESQNQTIARHLKKYKSITPFKALYEYGIMRLAARCYDLKSEGIPIKSELIDVGDGIKYARYTLMSSK